VRVQAFEAAGAAACAADAQVELRAQAPLLLRRALEAGVQLRVLDCGARPALDSARRFEPRDGGDEMRACEPERRRERLDGVVERRLLGHGGLAERAADGDPPERARRPA
jgi:hypothetical protein